MIDEVLLSADHALRDVLALGLVLLLLVQSALSQMRGWTIMYLTTHLNCNGSATCSAGWCACRCPGSRNASLAMCCRASARSGRSRIC
jgi:hypothetical protein